jgi:hypothetical protein
METKTRIFLTGKIEPGQKIKWNMAPLPVDVDPIDAAADTAFDAPCTISFFDHLIGCCAEVQTDTNMLVSRYMNRHGFLDMQSNYYLDGWHAATEGQPLAAMPTEYHEVGWWAAEACKLKVGDVSEQQDARDDEDFWRKGC